MTGRRGGDVLDDASDTGVPWRFMVSGSGSDIVNAVPPRERAGRQRGGVRTAQERVVRSSLIINSCSLSSVTVYNLQYILR